jgi:phage terminase small subunit
MSPEARRLWLRLHVNFRPDDVGSAQVLEAGLRAFDTMRQAEVILRAEGVVTQDRYGVSKAHPACDIARQARSQWIAALQLLGLPDPPRSSDAVRMTPKKQAAHDAITQQREAAAAWAKKSAAIYAAHGRGNGA